MKALFYPEVEWGTLRIPSIYSEIYGDGLYSVLGDKRDLVIVDAGANIGIVTAHMRENAKKIYAIEPSPLEFEALEANKVFNEWGNVEVFQFALSDTDGEVDFFVNPINRTGSTLRKAPGMIGERGFENPEKYYSPPIKVKTKRLSTFLREQNIERVDFMKMDIEGAEGEVLCDPEFASIADRIDSMLVEFHYPNWRDVAEIIKSYGYTAYKFKTEAIVCLFAKPGFM